MQNLMGERELHPGWEDIQTVSWVLFRAWNMALEHGTRLVHEREVQGSH